MSPSAVVNGDTPSTSSSAFLSHLTSYPVISDSLSTIQNNPYASKTIAISQNAYSTITNPIKPYISKSLEYASPYINKVDHVGDSALYTIEDKLPIVKKPTGELYNDGKSIAFFPLTKSLEGKDYLFTIYGQQMKKQNGDGLVYKGKAAVVTGLLITSNVVAWLSRMLGEKKKEAKEVANEKM